MIIVVIPELSKLVGFSQLIKKLSLLNLYSALSFAKKWSICSIFLQLIMQYHKIMTVKIYLYPWISCENPKYSQFQSNSMNSMEEHMINENITLIFVSLNSTAKIKFAK